MGVERDVWRDVTVHAHRLSKGGFVLVAFERALTDEIAAFHAAMLLGLSHRIVAVRDLESHSAEEKHRICRAKRIEIGRASCRERVYVQV
jgi:hypothetical protein